MSDKLPARSCQQDTLRQQAKSARECDRQPSYQELAARNAELERKAQELAREKNDIQDVLDSSGVATVLLDRSLRVRSYTPAFAAIFGLSPESTGRPFAPAEPGWDSLVHDAEVVLETGSRREREIDIGSGKRHFLSRLSPHLAADGEADGVALTLIDFTDMKRMESALREVDERHSLFIEHAPAALAMFDRNMRYLSASARWLRDYGLEGMEVRGVSHYQLFPEIPQRWKEAHARGLAGEVLRSEGEAFERADGSVQWVRWELRPWHDGTGAIGGIVIFAEDITDLKQTEASLRRTMRQVEENLAQMQTVLDSLTEAVVIFDMQGNLLQWNPGALALHEFDDPGSVRSIAGFAEIYEMATLDGEGIPVEQWPLSRILRGEVLEGYEAIVRRLDKEGERILSYRGRLARDRDGNPLMAVLSIVDTTERRRVEEAQAQLAAIVEGSEDAIFARDLSGIIRTWNTGAERMFGYGAEEVVGQSDGKLIPAELRAEDDALLLRVKAGERIAPFETVRLAKGNRALFVSITLSPIRDRRGRIVGASKIVRDVSAKKEAEELLQRSNVRLNLLAQSAGDLLVGASLGESIRKVGERVMRLLDCQVFFSYLADRAGQRLYLLASAGISEEEGRAVQYLEYGSSICGCAFEGGCPIVAENLATSRDPRTALVSSYGISAYACQPLEVRGRVLGTFSFGTRTRAHFSKDDVALMRAAADLAAIAVERHRAEQALRDSEERLRLAYQAARIGTFDYDVQSGLTRWSPEMAAMYGLEPTGQLRPLADWENRLHPDRKDEALCLLQQAFDSFEPVEGEWHVLWPDGSVRWLFARFQAFRDSSGKPVRLIGVNYDITERKGVMEALAAAKSEAEEGKQILDVLLKYIPLGITLVDADLTIRGISRYAREYLGVDAGTSIPEFVERTAIFFPDGATPIPFEELPLVRAVLKGETVRDAEIVQLVNGEPVSILCDSAPLRDASGAIIGGIVAWRDISERKTMLETLRKAHEELEQRVEERTEELASTVATLQGEIAERLRAEESLRRLNRLYEVLSEIDQAIIRAASWPSLFDDFCRIAVQHGGFPLAWVGLVDTAAGGIRRIAAAGATAYLDDIRVSMESEASGDGPMGIAIRNGTYYISNDFQRDPRTRPWHEAARAHGIRACASIALKEEERVVGALTLYAPEKDFFDVQQVTLLRQMGRDLSFALGNLLREAQRREAERALREETLERLSTVEELREKERLLIQQSRQAALGEMLGNIAHQWRQPLNSLGLMIQELILAYDNGTFSRQYLESSVEAVMQLVYHMSQTIDDFRTFFSPEKEKTTFNIRQTLEKVLGIIEGSFKGLGITLKIVADADPAVYGFPNEYSQVLLNILLNARDALVERRVAQPCITVTVSEEKGRAVLLVADNAGGIKEEIIDRIFDPYFTTKGPDQGTGVGLYMSKTIIEKNMYGTLSARNTAEGAEFRIEV